MDNQLRARLRRLDLFLELWPELSEEWRARLMEEASSVVLDLLRRG